MVPQLVRARGAYQGLLQQTHGARAHTRTHTRPHARTHTLPHYKDMYYWWYVGGEEETIIY